jgi:site-specific DNA recombinase
MDRQGFLDMVTAAARHELDAVMIYDISRGSRDVGDWFNFRKQMMHLGIKVISATQQLGDITNPNDFLVELISIRYNKLRKFKKV